MKRGRLVVAVTVVVLFAALTLAAGQDAVKAEIRQAMLCSPVLCSPVDSSP